MLSDRTRFRRRFIAAGSDGSNSVCYSDACLKSTEARGVGAGVGGLAGCDFSAAESLLVFVGCGGAAAGCDLAGACSGDSATATRRSGAFDASHAVAGVRTGLRVRDSVVCRDLLLDL